MKFLKRIYSHLLQKPRIPSEMIEYCATEVNKINQVRFKYFSLLFIIAMAIILLVYGSDMVRNGIEAVPMEYIALDVSFLLFLIVAYFLWSTVPYFQGKGFTALLYVISCMVFAWATTLSIFDNSVASLIMAFLLIPVGFIIKPLAFRIIQAIILLPLLIGLSFLRLESFALLVNYINILLCFVLASYLCRTTYNLIMESITSRRTVELKNAELNELTVQLKNLSETDALTSLLNRRKFNEIMDREWNRAIRGSSNLVMIIYDIDYFKNYNDTYGHLKGDECLKQISQSLKEKFKRSNEYLARFGGEEFVLIMVNVTQKEGKKACTLILETVRDLAIPTTPSEVAEIVTVSAGMASVLPHKGDHLEDFINSADAALYEAKRTGRNRYTIATSL